MADLRPGVLLDLDGTLIDTNYLHTLAWWRALIDIGEWAPMNAIHRLVGMGGDQLVPHLLGKEKDGASHAWRVHYDELVGDARPFPFAKEFVERASDKGLRVALATSSPADLVHRAMKTIGIEDMVDTVTSADDVESSKPDPSVFETAMRMAGIDPALAVAVGDSVWDVDAARGAGIACVAVETGGFSRHELSEAGAIAVYRDVEELFRQLSTSPLARLFP